jgi:hypothetical protein
VPQAPFCPLQVANRFIGKVCAGRTRAETARRLQRVLKTNGDMPPIEHNRGCWQGLALHSPQPGITIAQHCRRRVGMHPGCIERLRECFGRGLLAVPGEGEAVLDAIGVDRLPAITSKWRSSYRCRLRT